MFLINFLNSKHYSYSYSQYIYKTPIQFVDNEIHIQIFLNRCVEQPFNIGITLLWPLSGMTLG